MQLPGFEQIPGRASTVAGTAIGGGGGLAEKVQIRSRRIGPLRGRFLMVAHTGTDVAEAGIGLRDFYFFSLSAALHPSPHPSLSAALQAESVCGRWLNSHI
jgi:hypothetical protein